MLIRIAPEPRTSVSTVGPGDELVLVVELPPADAPRTLTLELTRGTERRHRAERRLEPCAGPLVLAFRVSWTDRPGASPRLTCRVRLDGRVIGEPSVLLAPAADAQGRFADAPRGPIGEHTRVAFLSAFDQLLDPSV